MRCVWQIMLFNFAFNLFSSYIATTAAPYLMSTWAGVENLNSSIHSVFSDLIFAGMLAVMDKWGTMWNWRLWLVVTTLGANAIDSVVQFLTIYDIFRNQWFYLGVPLAEQIPYGIQFIITTFAIVEVADVGNEVFDSMITNKYGDQFHVTAEDIESDDDDAKNQVAYIYLIYYATTVFACFWIILFPTQRRCCKNGMITGFAILVMSITFNILTMFQSTKCLHFAGVHGCD